MTRLTEAVAFTDACDRCRVRERDRAVILQKARRLDRMADWLASAPTSDARRLREAYDAALEKARRDVRDASDWRAVTLLDAAYPERLRHISEPPAVLFWSGTSLDALQEAFVLAVVGTRRPTAYGVEVTRRLTREAVLHGVPIVSGGARGIDGEAHRAALNLGGPTYAVLGCGLGVVYPPEHETLFNEIAHNGALITRYVPGTAPKRHHFPARNRIMAGLADAVLVTEASAQSGTLITAGFAADHGRDVLAVPGSILAGTSKSCHDLIRDGAILVERVQDIPGMPAAHVERHRQTSFASPDVTSSHGPEAALLLELIDNAPRTLSELTEATGWPFRSVALCLALLQKTGDVIFDRGRYRRATSP